MSNFCFPVRRQPLVLDETTLVNLPGTGTLIAIDANGHLKRVVAAPSPAPAPAPVGTPAPAPAPSPAPAPAPAPVPPAPPPTQILPYGRDPSLYYKLAFQDEFSGSVLSTANWNKALWYETDPGMDNYAVNNGTLKIWPKKDASGNWVGHNRTLDTDGKFYQRYGYFEVEAKLPRGKGCWPAFWLQGHDGDDRPQLVAMEAFCGGGWENWWSTDDNRPVNYRGIVWSPQVVNMGDRTMLGEIDTLQQQYYAGQGAALDLSAAFHKYGMHWDSTGVQFFFDGVAVGERVLTGVHNSMLYITVNLWLGTVDLPTAGLPDNTTPQTPIYPYELKYVRTWALSDGSTQLGGTVPPPGQ